MTNPKNISDAPMPTFSLDSTVYAAMLGIWPAKPKPTPYRTWYPTHAPVEEFTCRVVSRPAPTAIMQTPRMRKGV
jgi:hypothetical protein